MNWNCVVAKKAENDFGLLEKAGLLKKAIQLLLIVKENPFTNPPPYEKLVGLKDSYSRRIDAKHRFVYRIYKKEQIIQIIRMWSHYE